MILHQYFAKRFLMIFLSVTVIFSLFIGLIGFVEQLRRFGGNTEMLQIAQMTLVNLPAELYEIVPLISILAALWFFLALARSSEMVISRAAGRSVFQLLVAPVVAMLVFGALIVGLGNPIVASTKKQYVELREEFIDGRRAQFSIGAEGLWLRQGDENGQTVIRAARSNLDGLVLFDVSLISYADQGGPNRRIEADTARLEEGKWVLRNATVWPINYGVNPQSLAQNVRQFDVPSNLTLEQIRDRIGNPSSIPIWDLPAYIAQLETAGFSARRHTVWFHMEIARPLFLVGMLLIGASFTMRHVRFGGTGQALVLSIVIGFSLYYVRNFAQVLGETGQIPVLFAAYAPPIATILLATGIILHMEDG